MEVARKRGKFQDGTLACVHTLGDTNKIQAMFTFHSSALPEPPSPANSIRSCQMPLWGVWTVTEELVV